MRAELQLSLLGTPQLRLGQQDVTDKITGKPLALCSYLAVTGRPHARDVLADLLWSELSNQQARNNLRYLLPDLRQLIGDHLIITPHTISFNLQQPYWLDVHVLCKTLEAQPAADLPALQTALDLYGGEFLAGFSVRHAPVFSEWVSSQRATLHNQIVQGLYRAAQHYWQAGHCEAGLASTQRLLALEPWYEPGHYLRMLLLAHSGQRTAALAQFAECRAALAAELGVEPGAETILLYEKIRNGAYTGQNGHRKKRAPQTAETPAVAEPVDPSAPPAPVLPPHNLPGQLTPFIGRQKEVAQLCALLADPAHRLITVTGLGGIGKTRFALAACQAILTDATLAALFPAGVWFVPLMEVAATDNVADGLALAMATTLRLPRSDQMDPVAQLLEALPQRPMLLMLDNFEHLVMGVDFLFTLLQRAPALKLIVTSRQILHLQAEYIWQLAGLSVPQPSAEVKGSPLELHGYDGVQLFVERARRVDHTFRLHRGNQAEVARICHGVEGLPLAIELAAAMVKYYSCGQIWHSLTHDYALLGANQRDLPLRHRTLKIMLDSSWQRLTVDQARVLTTCALFPQAFSREAVLAIAEAPPADLFALLDHSLLKQADTGQFELHEIVRQYALAQLQQDRGEAQVRRHRYAAYYASLIETDMNDYFRSPAIAKQVQQELANIRLAWQWCVAERQTALISQMKEAVFLHYLAQGPLQEGWGLIAAGLQMLRAIPPTQRQEGEWRMLALGLACQSVYAYFLGWRAEAGQLTEEAIALGRQWGDAPSLAIVYLAQSLFAFIQGELEEQEKLSRLGLAYAKSGDLAALEVINLANLGFALGLQGKVNEGLAVSYAGLQRLHEQNFRLLEGYVLNQLGFVYAMSGDWALADTATQQALQIGQLLDHSFHRGYQYSRMALYAEATGDYARALTLSNQALAFDHTFHDLRNRLDTLLVLGRVLQQLGDWEAAQTSLEQAATLAQDLQAQAEIAKAYIELGQVALAREAWQAAEQHFCLASSITQRDHLPCVAAAQTGLADLYFRTGQMTEAWKYVMACLPRLLGETFATEYGAVPAALVAYQLLAHYQDPRAEAVVEQAYTWLQTQAQKISDAALRHAFLENVPTHREVLVLAHSAYCHDSNSKQSLSGGRVLCP